MRQQRKRSVCFALLIILILFFQTACSSLIGPSGYRSIILYHVKKGDSVAAIAKRFEVSVDEIVAENSLSDPSEIEIGALIRVPYRGSVANKNKENISKSTYSKNKNTVMLSAAKRYVGRLLWPITKGKVSSEFGHRWLSFHEGIDIVAPLGTTIRAAHDGEVVYSGSGLRGYGNLVVVKGQDIITVYAHNRANLVGQGEDVLQGQPIAELGESGKATGPHLHFEVRIKDSKGLNVAVNPLIFYPVKQR